MAGRSLLESPLHRGTQAQAKARIAEVLKANDGNIRQAAESLGITRQTLYTHVKALGLGTLVARARRKS